ncbi:tyrosine-protein phosphatase [Devosia sp. 63-57]|uniref:tyrosine-protein phosphatase n=1 Tax=Devosia sp. 63-57 TaxID=1895751 RepID=UPI00086A3453|nr:tyrosine-protein phosphatase [Devosia sp. 63-57]ODT48049.1 MAG: protein tyrosine phosphatase [Pelagibacterium sp. SCN 63-126]ODU85574.1 MAG: protein tyrosine phosphatase [Pelagibacterium sp. SCN 63-17]OJX42243.1 MAG: protein tyrosine phosphatase [Devosia sp. 63-57]
MHTTRHLPVPGTHNIRDLGGYATAVGTTRFRRLLRADALHRLDASGIESLLASGVTTVIDLRHDDELAHQPNPFAGHEHVGYHNVSLFDGLAPDLMADGDVLLELYILALQSRQDSIAAVLTHIADAPGGAVLFHCTAGKDRTGIIAALLLSLVGVEAQDIVADYAQTAALIAPIVADITAGAVARGADPERFKRLLASDPETMVATLAFIETEFGSVPAYLEQIGLGEDTITQLRHRLLGDF